MAPASIILAHGGEWRSDNSYTGGRRELIPIPNDGIDFTKLLRKIELRIMKPKSGYMYEIDALVQSPTNEIMRIKITDDFELSYVMGSAEIPVLHITTTPINVKLSRVLLDQNVLSPTPVAPAMNRNHFNFDNDEEGLNFDQREVVYEDVDEEDVDVDGENISAEDCGSIRHNVSPLDNSHDFVEGRESRRHNVSPLDNSHDSGERDREVVRQWIIPGASFHSSLPIQDLGAEIIDDCTIDSLAVGAIFSNKANLIASVGMYHLVNHVEFFTKKSSKERYHLVCKHNKDTCPFVLRARAVGNAWIVGGWHTHTCEKDLRYHADPTVFSKVLAAYFVPTLMVEGVVLRPRDIMAQVQRLFGAKIKYRTALAARNQALAMTYGDSSKSFQMLPKYLYMLEQSNPGSIVDFKTDEHGTFHYCYMALGACIRGFQACRPVIVVDGTHLKGKYNGIMFVAATKDANEQILPLAFGIGDKESGESWTWFLRQCRRTFGCPENMLFVSDNHRGIKNALDAVYPGTPHGLCVYHLQGNLKRWGERAIAMFKHAANAYRCRDFEERMNNLKSFSPSAYNKLMTVDPIRWARSKCPVRRYRFLTSNSAECLNGRLRWARKLPICTLLECIRTMIGQWFVERRVDAMNRTEELTNYGEARLARAAELAHNMSIEAISPTKFKVSSTTKHHVVDIQSRECTCLIFNHNLIPCSHAAAAICQTKQSAVSYVSDYYTTHTLREIYAEEVMPIPIPEDWCIPPEVSSIVVGTPPNTRQSGRPRENRMSSGSGSGSSSRKVCSRCGQRGHYQNTCDAHIQLTVEEVSSSQPVNTSKRRRPKRCGICGIDGHTRQTCSQNVNPS